MATESADDIAIGLLPALADSDIEQLADVLIDCVAGGASVNFMHPLGRDKAVAFWRRLAGDVAVGGRTLLVARDAIGIVGTVQVVPAQPDNQPHRADIAKMLVHRRARRRGVGTALMRAAENAAREAGKTLLVLDTATRRCRASLRTAWLDACRRHSRLRALAAGRVVQHQLLLS